MTTTGNDQSQSRNTVKTTGRLLGEFFPANASEHDMWQFFNPLQRKWEFLRVRKLPGQSNHSVILRNGWIVRTVQKGRPPYFYSVEDGRLRNIKPDAASFLAYEYITGSRTLELSRTPEGLLIDLNAIFLPQSAYSELLKLGELRNILDENSLLIPAENLEKGRAILGPLGIGVTIHDESAPIATRPVSNVSSRISDILTLLYSRYLKKEAEIERLQVALLTRDFSGIFYPEVKSALESVYDRAAGNIENHVIGRFLSDRVASFFDWKDVQDLGARPTIDGVILQTVPKEFIGKWSTNYYKIIVPELESVLHLQTTISPTRHGVGKVHPLAVRLNKIALDRWRIYPYLGKLKNTGTNQEVRFQDSEKVFIDSAFSSILGIPSIETILRKLYYLDSFKLDLEEWRGSYDLTRYFIAYARVKETMDVAAKTPCTILEDFFGNTFTLAWDYNTYEHYKADIHAIKPGGYISVLLENKLNNARNDEDGIDFETVFGLSHRFVKKEEFILENALAMVKYVGSVEAKELGNLIRFFHKDVDMNSILKNLEDRLLVVVRNNVIHYLYRSLTKEQLTTLLEMAEHPEKNLDQTALRQRWYILWSLMRESISSIHPLIYSESVYDHQSIAMMKTEQYSKILDFCRKAKNFQKARAQERSKIRTNYVFNLRRDENLQFWETLVGDKPEEKYTHHSSLMLRMFGQASIKARGRWIAKAHNVVKYITRRFSYMEPAVKRIDRVTVSPEGKKVKEAEFQVEIFKLG